MTQFCQQRLRLLQTLGVKPFSEPVVDYEAQLRRLRLLLTGNLDGFEETLLWSGVGEWAIFSSSPVLPFGAIAIHLRESWVIPAIDV